MKNIESYLAGLITGDGHIDTKTNKITITTKNSKFKDVIYVLLKKLKFKPTITFDVSGGKVWRVSLYSNKFKMKLINKYNLGKGNKTPQIKYPTPPKTNTIEFLSGLYDAEGWFEIDKNKYYRIRFKIKNKPIADFVRKELNRHNFRPTSHRKTEGSYVVDINKQKDVAKFMRTFVLLHPKWLKVTFSIGGRPGYPRLHAARNG